MDVDSTSDRAEEFAERAAEYAVDTANGDRIGVVQERFEGSVYLRPPGGGVEWTTRPEALRHPSATELVQARVLDTPVQGRRNR
ncbi:hypothetical protein ACFYN0_24435 [Streptomyces sp. NPDC006704]|uniref:hypothetical protein n=1 Tax=Streptomyces sp. NPDC006704 TaxID=3364760 RepID=UPI0036BC606B